MDKRERAIWIKMELLKKGWTQRDIAMKLKCSDSYISQLVKGERSNLEFDKLIIKHLGSPCQL